MGLEQGRPEIPEQKDNRQAKIVGVLEQTKKNRSKAFEPFGEPEAKKEDLLFINEYNGHYAQNMELNRNAVERVQKIAHLDGPVFLTSMPYSREISFDANSDGSVSAKKTLLFGERIKKDRENPHMKVTSLPIGWKIEVNNQAIMENLMEKRLDPQNRQKVFIKEFNDLIINGLWNCIVKEKLSNIKDRYFEDKVKASIVAPALNTMFALLPPQGLSDFIWPLLTMLNFALLNGLNTLRANQMKQMEEMVKILGVNTRRDSSFIVRRLDHPWDYVMPMVEIDKVMESFIYLSVAGRTLVRQKKSFAKSASNSLK